MNNKLEPSALAVPGFNISAVERETGLSKDVLRMWERRYGFPAPARDAYGERVYSTTDVEQLRLIKRLIDKGFRPGKLLSTPIEALQALLQTEAPETVGTALPMDCTPYLDCLRAGEIDSLRTQLQQFIARQGIHRFVLDTAAPLTIAVGEAWMAGNLRVHEEHVYSELLKSLLRQNMPPSSRGDRPSILLTTVPEEEHGLGLLMAEVLFSIEGARCISLGTRTPLIDIVEAAERHAVDCVALSFSEGFPPRAGSQQIAELRQRLPGHMALWIGGAGAMRLQRAPGIECCHGEDGPARQIAQWRASHP